MISDHLHQQLYEDLINKSYSTHKAKHKKIDKRWVCLTGPHTQKKGNRKCNKVCFILYGPNMNYGGQTGAVHCNRQFWDDIFKRKEMGIRFHEDVYDLFKRVHYLLEYKQSYKKDWVWCDVKDWNDFSVIVRMFNRI